MMKKGKIKAMVCGLVLVLGTTLFVGCGNRASQEKDASKAKTKIEKIKENGKIVLGTCADYPPYEYGKMKDGKMEYVGFDIEIAKEIAKDLGVKLEISNMEFKPLVQAVKVGKVDFVISGMTPTPDRMKEIDFSKVYYKSDQSIIIRKADKDKYTNLDSLKGKSVGAQLSSVQETVVKEEMKESKLLSLGKVNELIMSLKTKKVEFVVVDEPVAKAYVKQNSDLMVANIKIGEPSDFAIGIQKGNKDLVDAINKTIDRLNKDYQINKLVDEAGDKASKIK